MREPGQPFTRWQGDTGGLPAAGHSRSALAVLAVAVTIAVARLSLRRPRPPKQQDGTPGSG